MRTAHLAAETATAREINPGATIISAMLVIAALAIVVVVTGVVLG